MLKLTVPTRSDVQQAIEHVKNGVRGPFADPSMTTYILCPLGDDLWDIKLVGGLIWNTEITSQHKRKYTTDRFARPLIEAGYSVVKFNKKMHRNLGVNGCDLSELNEPHTVYYPNGSKSENGFCSTEKEILFPDGKKRSVILNSYVRNSLYKMSVLSAADGVCDACKTRIFQKPDGTWFLEVHHQIWLSEGGPDHPDNMVALCPNCHRQEHFGTKRLYLRVS